MNTLILLIIEFFKTGLFAIGGGLATIPFLNEMSIKYGWFSTDMLSTMIAVSESTPGAIGINMATYVGYVMFNITGAIATSLSLVTPSIIIIVIIANMMDKFKNSKLIKALFIGLRPTVIGLILSACMNIFISALLDINLYESSKNIFTLLKVPSILLLALLLIICKKYKQIHPMFIVLIGGIIGVVFKL